MSGSVRGHGDARAFYRGLDVVPVDMTAALDAADPLLADPPLHPSYEDRRDARDRVFAGRRRRTSTSTRSTPGRARSRTPAPPRPTSCTCTT